MNDNKRVLLLLTAHADDTEFFAGGTVARFAAEGWRVIEVIATDNSRGSFELDSRTLVEQSRRVEAAAAAKIIGKDEVEFLGYPDGYLDDTPKNTLREIYMRRIRMHRPRVVMTFDAWAPLEPHPDHRHVAIAAMEAIAFACLPLYHPEHSAEGLMPHLAPERYYFAKNPERADTVVDVTGYIDKKIEALCVQESQMKLTIDELRLSIGATGRHTEMLAALDRNNYRPIIEMSVRAIAAGIGAKKGFGYGEEFRFEHAAALLDAIAL